MLLFCPDKLLELRLTASYISGQRTEGLNGTAIDGVLGNDLTSFQDPRV